MVAVVDRRPAISKVRETGNWPTNPLRMPLLTAITARYHILASLSRITEEADFCLMYHCISATERCADADPCTQIQPFGLELSVLIHIYLSCLWNSKDG